MKAEQNLPLYLGSCSKLAEESLFTSYGTGKVQRKAQQENTGATPRQGGGCSPGHTAASDIPESWIKEKKKNDIDNILGLTWKFLRLSNQIRYVWMKVLSSGMLHRVFLDISLCLWHLSTSLSCISEAWQTVNNSHKWIFTLKIVIWKDY